MTQWRPDSCQCIINFTSAIPHKIENIVQLCQIHKDISHNELFETIRIHNSQYSSEEMLTKRSEEFKRILSLGAPIKSR